MKTFHFFDTFCHLEPRWRKSKSAIGRRWPANQRILFCFVCSRLAPSFTAEGWLSSGGFFQNEKGGQQLIPLRIHQNKRASPPPLRGLLLTRQDQQLLLYRRFFRLFPCPLQYESKMALRLVLPFVNQDIFFVCVVAFQWAFDSGAGRKVAAFP